MYIGVVNVRVISRMPTQHFVERIEGFSRNIYTYIYIYHIIYIYIYIYIYEYIYIYIHAYICGINKLVGKLLLLFQKNALMI